MRRLISFVAAGLVALSLGSTAQAGRMGGPISGMVTIPAHEFVYYDIPFEAGAPAAVSVAADRQGFIELTLFDSLGTFVVGQGIGDRKMVSMNVVQSGFFRVVVRNAGSVPVTCVMGTN